MLTYLIRRICYALPILIGVNLLTFLLFFFVYTPEDLAKTAVGEKHASPEQIQSWMREHGYDLPRLWNGGETGTARLTRTIFWEKSVSLFFFDFGKSDANDARIGEEIRRRIGPSLSITVPMFLIPLVLNTVVAMFVAFYRGTYIDFSTMILCVVLMSVSILFYILFGQFVLARWLKLLPVSGFDSGWQRIQFVALPVLIGVAATLGQGIRYYRTLFLEEINKDYVRTARAKGLSEGVVLFKHTLKNALIPILTSVVVMIPFLITGNLLLEQFFSIPGLGSYLILAIQTQDFAVVRAMVYLGAILYVSGLILVDVSYTLVDPRIRLS